MAKIKLFLDEDVHSALSGILQKRGFDAIHAQDFDRKGRSDSEQLAFAVQQRRTVLSFNASPMGICLETKIPECSKSCWR